MATITLEYNARNKLANRIIEVILAMDNVFKVKDHRETNNSYLTQEAIQDAENGNVVVCDSYVDYLKHTSKYA
ncbi:MAG: hypothetical protein FWH23_03755 [Bacteroidales bacterium]|nr:hypothetical protein [Bacteroidales bacterium]MCL2133648.1 hypothetical protein [Bacteroidales bacterium]